MYGFVMRSTLEFRNAHTYIHLYKSLVRSQLEYAVAVWNPLYNIYVDNLEMVQRKFLKSMHFRCTKSNATYEDLLKNYNVMCLKSRRLFLEMMLLYDICGNRYNCTELTSSLSYIVPRTVIRRQVRTRPLFAVPPCRTNAGVRAPLRRLCQNYNDNFTDLDIFAMRANVFRTTLIENIKQIKE